MMQHISKQGINPDKPILLLLHGTGGNEHSLELLDQAEASVEIHWENNGHQLTMSEAQAAKEWYQENY